MLLAIGIFLVIVVLFLFRSKRGKVNESISFGMFMNGKTVEGKEKNFHSEDKEDSIFDKINNFFDNGSNAGPFDNGDDNDGDGDL